MRCLVACCLGLALVGAASGCRSCHRVEAELRAREEDVRELREELDRCSIYNQTLQQEVRSLRGEIGLGPDGQPPAAYPVQGVVLGRQTGGRSNGNCPGDDALQVQLEPRDPDGQAIKAPGALLVQVQEITKEGVKRPLSAWEFPPDQLRRSWRNTLLTTGYVLNLPWKVWPSTDHLRVTAQFQLLDGRVFEAEKDITVRLTPANRRPAVVPDQMPKAPEDGGPPLLPPPRPIDPGKMSKPAPPVPMPAPFTGAPPETNGPQLLWQKVDPPPSPPAAEALRPVPLPRAK